MLAAEVLDQLKAHRQSLGFATRGRWSGPHVQEGFQGPFWIGPRCLVVVSILDDTMAVVTQFTGGSLIIPDELLEEVARRFFMDVDLPKKASKSQRARLEGVRAVDPVMVVPLEPDLSDFNVSP